MGTRENSPSTGEEPMLHNNTMESENLTFFNDLDEYINEIKSRLAISKMVSHSILKGVVTAIEQEASEKDAEIPNSLNSSTITLFENLTMKQLQKVKQEIKKSNHHKDSPNLTKATEELSRTLHSLFQRAKETKTHQESHLETHIETTVTSICLKEQLEMVKPVKPNHTLRKIAALKDDLDELSKSFSESEGFFTYTENHKEPTSQVALKALRWEENGKSDPSVILMPENLDLSQLKHLTKDELGSRLKLEMMKLKRHFEQRIHGMTEEIFALKRDYSKGRTSWKIQTHEHQKVPDIIQSLRAILEECGDLVASNGEKMNMGTIVAENHHLKETLADRERTVHCLSAKLSDATENLSKQFVAELKLKRMLNDAKKEKHDVYTEALLTNDLFVFLLKEALSDAAFRQESEEVDKIKRKANELCRRMDDFEEFALKSIGKNSSRLESLRGSVGSGHVARMLERKASDLEKAEAEVDLLGDEVDALLSLLEKIYIALDHYSPVLVHYPGIIEILKLIKRELCGANSKHF